MTDVINRLLDDVIGRWFVYAGLVVALGLAGAGFARIFISKLNSALEDIGLVKEQVANDHRHPDGSPINLRDDQDSKHDETTSKLDIVISLVQGQGKSIAALQSGQSSLYALIRENSTDIEELKSVADTRTREEINRLQKEIQS